MIQTHKPKVLLLTLLLSALPPLVQSFTNNGDAAFSLSVYQKERAIETSQSLDASRNHFQILFVDDDNTKGRIAEGILARVAEYNDAMCVLFPSSATIESSRNAPRDAAAPEAAVAVCEALGLCSTRSTMMGTSFDLSYLDEYDLIVAMDDDIRSLILRSLSVTDQEYYGPKCRLLSEFLSPEFCGISQHVNPDSNSNSEPPVIEATKTTTDGDTMNQPLNIELLLNTLDPDLKDRVTPFWEDVIDRSSTVITQPESSAMQTAALILASSGLVRFCLDTIDAQLEAAFQSLLQNNFHSREHVRSMDNNRNGSSTDASNRYWEQVDAQLRRSCSSVTGFFSPGQRRVRFERHMDGLRLKFASELE